MRMHGLKYIPVHLIACLTCGQYIHLTNVAIQKFGVRSLRISFSLLFTAASIDQLVAC